MLTVILVIVGGICLCFCGSILGWILEALSFVVEFLFQGCGFLFTCLIELMVIGFLILMVCCLFI